MKFLTLLLCLITVPLANGAQLTVHAAASLTDAMKEIARSYEEQTGDQIRLNFDASSLLVRQIEEGAPADVFLSADEARMNELGKKRLLAPGTRRTLLTNSLVIVVPDDSQLPIHRPADLALNNQIKKIAISQPNTVPVGIYTREYLTRLRLWKKILPKVVPTQNVRASLAAVASGNVQAGFVYKTDALISSRVKVACEIPPAQGPAIRYPVAALAASSDLTAAKRFLTYLETPAAQAVFRKYGFIAPQAPPRSSSHPHH